jgi:hypothetical protein
MSFHVEFVAATKARAKDIVKAQHLPDVVRAFVNHAIDCLADSTESHPSVVSVKAIGHLCEGSGSYSVSNANIEVRPISLSA